MHINAIRAYHVELVAGEPQDKESLSDSFSGETIVSIHRISEEPRILRVVTSFAISGHGGAKDDKKAKKAKK